MENKVTAFILTQNNESTISGCLESVQWCDSIVVIDSYSTDRTLEIIHSFPQIQLYQHEYSNAREQRIWGMQKVNTKWVFIIDSDEYCPEPLALKLRELVSADDSSYDGYLVFTRTMFMGRLLTHQDYLSSFGKRLVLTKVATRYHKNVRVHASIKLDNRKFLTKQFYLIHDPIRSISQHLAKMNRYAQWQAADLYDRGNVPHWWHFTLRPLGKFLKHYLLNGGFRDGLPGLVIDLFGALAVFMKFLYLKELIHAETKT